MTTTQVGIIGAGPAGLVLAHRMADAGIAAVVLESRDRAYVEARVRACVLEAPTVGLLEDMGLADRLHREGLVHEGAYLQWDGKRHRIDFRALTGKAVTVYGQQARAPSPATSSLAVTASTASAGPASRPARSAPTTGTTPSPGWGSLPVSPRRPTS